ncbi:hypothetical protein [Pectobacterium jejuense]|uniref:hypothetical protein n=1 Tax=Pectobacterium jejuense TaxID=2974022 RepID=UPI00228247C9|nr:hypothetical protein [Pectobacterium jejuense]MCY9848228.1 hypothetical protein [Pectobacterium jejuense]
MKTSELIKRLIEIDKTVPFDADIVQGNDYEFDTLQKVYHNPPHTYLVFDTPQPYDSEDGFSILEELMIRSHQTNEIRKIIEEGSDFKADILQNLSDMSKKIDAMIENLSK